MAIITTTINPHAQRSVESTMAVATTRQVLRVASSVEDGEVMEVEAAQVAVEEMEGEVVEVGVARWV
jgi:Asp/Glu/hydantoin racemase